MELRTFARLLRDGWIVILVVTVLTAATGALLTWRQTPQYAARTTLFVSTWTDASDASAAYQAALLSEQKVLSYTQLLDDHRLMQRVADRLQLTTSPDQLAGKVTGEAMPDTTLILLTATDPSPTLAARIADASAAEFVKLIPTLEGLPNGQRSAVRITVVSAAEIPDAPVSPRPMRNLALALALGLLLGVGLAAARQSLDTTVKSLEETEEASGEPALGAVPFDASAGRNPIVGGQQTHGHRAEAYRKIRTSLQFVDVDREHKVLLVTSCVPAEGKSVTACNLALSLAETGRRVLLIDADLRRPCAARYLGLPSGAGLTSVLLNKSTHSVAVQAWGLTPFWVLASGAIPPNPTEMLGSQHMHKLMEDLRESYDVIIVDAPPVLPVADALAIAPACDGVILVARYGRTRRDQLAQTTAALRRTKVDVLGTVLNRTPRRAKDSYYDEHYVSHHDGYPESAALEAAARTTVPHPAESPVSM
ncbi:MAG: polysaccharide biosynthesis tyrosine autokinase [Actinoplanes sp.]